MDILTDPSIWIGLATLVVLEIVLGIDNLVFIAILADKLPREQRDRARQIGPTLALLAMVRRGGCGARPTCISSSRSWATSRW